MDVQETFTPREQVEILDDTPPRLDDYSSPQEWFSALTEWHIEVGLKVQQLPKIPAPLTMPHPNNSACNGHIGRAAYLLGVQALDGLIVPDLNDPNSLSNYTSALTVLACHLEKTEPDRPGEMAYLHDY